MVRSGRSAGLTPAPCAAANPGLASDETAAADAPRNPRRELVFDIIVSIEPYTLNHTPTGWQAKAPAPPKRKRLRTSVGQTLSSVNPAISARACRSPALVLSIAWSFSPAGLSPIMITEFDSK